MDPNMDPKKRLHLNFGGLGGGGTYNNDRNYTPTNERVFPTTPSTFPQSVFQASHPANDYVGAQVQQNGYAAQAGYFPTGAYQAQYSSPQSPYQQNQGQFQGQYANQHQQQNLVTPQSSYQQRQTGFNPNDPTTGLARQFSNQNLGPSQRQASPLGRQPSPSSRLYPNAPQGQIQQTRNQQSYVTNQQSQSSLLAPPVADSNAQSLSPSTEEPPEKNGDKYSINVAKRGHGLHALVEAFFKENIVRARDRNLRYVFCYRIEQGLDKSFVHKILLTTLAVGVEHLKTFSNARTKPSRKSSEKRRMFATMKTNTFAFYVPERRLQILLRSIRLEKEHLVKSSL